MAQILTILFILNISLFAEFKVKSFSQIRYHSVVKQTYEESCGAAALSTLFNLYGYETSEEKILENLNTTNIVTFSDLQRVALNNNFNAKGYKISKEVFEKINTPIIARIVRKMDYPHFVVIQNLNKNSLVIFDPNAGKYLISKKEFYSYWIEKDSNYILIVIPLDKKKQAKKLESSFQKYIF